ncbi:DHHW family protein [Oceanobacillus damuensis]|uniref:DHHW family protein n=1 Tax=Oceanobacillus damuensis TaxID=937928 RepID=UPI00082A0874|nr:DHHW family protein [Oceanobacillus damuensis]
MKLFSNLILIILFAAFLLFFGSMVFLTNDHDISESENRSLAQKPEIDKESIIDGTYMQKFESYITDQFYYRDDWIKSHLLWQKVTNQTFLNDNYYIDGEWVYPKPFTEVNKDAIQMATTNIEQLKDYTNKREISLYFFSLPDRRNMLDINYPGWVEPSIGDLDKETLLSKFPEEHIQVIDVADEWQKKFGLKDYKDFYYKTDHHWNMTGALAAYEVIRNTFDASMPIYEDGPFNPEEFTKKCIKDKTFMGIYNQQLYETLEPSGEEICYAVSNQIQTGKWQTFIRGLEPENEVSFQDIFGKANQLNQEQVTYAEVFTTDYSELHIINPYKKEKNSKVLFLKDSYANPLVPLLANHFQHTTFYDLRHNKGESLYDYLEKGDYDAVVFLYSNGRTLDHLFDFDQTK